MYQTALVVVLIFTWFSIIIYAGVKNLLNFYFDKKQAAYCLIIREIGLTVEKVLDPSKKDAFDREMEKIRDSVAFNLKKG